MNRILIFTFFFAICAASLSAQTVSLDPTFGKEGMTIIPNTTEIKLLDFDKLGNIIAIGETHVDGKNYLTITKTNPNGIPEQNFGSGGTATILEYELLDSPLGLKIRDENKIFISGIFRITETDEVKSMFMQFNEDGSFDETFGDKGKIFLIMGGDSYIYSVNLENKDFVLFGCALSSSDIPYISKYNYAGERVANFGENGRLYLTNNETFSISPKSIKILNDQSIFICGNALLKIDRNGNYIKDFANNGIWDIPFYTFEQMSITDIIEDNNQNLILLIAFYDNANPTDLESCLYRLYPDGTTDKDFGNEGYCLNYFQTYFEPNISVKILESESRFIIGYHNEVVGINLNGTLDLSFNQTGMFKCENFTFKEMKFQDADKLVLGGTSKGNFAIARLIIPPKISVKELSSTDKTITIFPIPANNNIYFSQETKFEIMDIQGNVLLKSEKAIQVANVSFLKAGVYFVRFGDGSVGKFVKE